MSNYQSNADIVTALKSLSVKLHISEEEALTRILCHFFSNTVKESQEQKIFLKNSKQKISFDIPECLLDEPDLTYKKEINGIASFTPKIAVYKNKTFLRERKETATTKKFSFDLEEFKKYLETFNEYSYKKEEIQDQAYSSENSYSHSCSHSDGISWSNGNGLSVSVGHSTECSNNGCRVSVGTGLPVSYGTSFGSTEAVSFPNKTVEYEEKTILVPKQRKETITYTLEEFKKTFCSFTIFCRNINEMEELTANPIFNEIISLCEQKGFELNLMLKPEFVKVKKIKNDCSLVEGDNIDKYNVRSKTFLKNFEEGKIIIKALEENEKLN